MRAHVGLLRQVSGFTQRDRCGGAIRVDRDVLMTPGDLVVLSAYLMNGAELIRRAFGVDVITIGMQRKLAQEAHADGFDNLQVFLLVRKRSEILMVGSVESVHGSVELWAIPNLSILSGESICDTLGRICGSVFAADTETPRVVFKRLIKSYPLRTARYLFEVDVEDSWILSRGNPEVRRVHRWLEPADPFQGWIHAGSQDIMDALRVPDHTRNGPVGNPLPASRASAATASGTVPSPPKEQFIRAR